MTKRYEDWPRRMEEAISAARDVPFGYGPGQNHCCLFTADVALAMTGEDMLSPLRGKYTTEKMAYLVLRKFTKGGGIVEYMEYVSKAHSIPEIPVSHAQRGDAVLFYEEGTSNPGLGVCVGDRFVSVIKTGIAFAPMAKALKAWAV